MAERARSITAARLNDRLPIDNPSDELGQLASVFNDTLGRLELSFNQMRRFTADVSHEIRTPLTAIRTVGEVGLREARDPRSYQSIISSMLEEAGCRRSSIGCSRCRVRRRASRSCRWKWSTSARWRRTWRRNSESSRRKSGSR
jgi:signal transduction histidine kinase